MIEEDVVPLSDLPAGIEFAIRRVGAEDPELLRHLADRGLRPGVVVTIVERQPFNGPITIRLAETEQVIGPEVAHHLLCASAHEGAA